MLMAFLYTKSKFMETHFALSNQDFIDSLKNCSLNPKLFNHEAHLRLAWLLIDKYGIEKAIVYMEELLLNFVIHVGARDKYHKTLTIAAMHIVNNYMVNEGRSDFKEFIIKHDELNTNFKAILNSYYSFDVFKAKHAANEFIQPDLKSF